MWVARDNDGTFIFENKPILNGTMWVVESGYYFIIPNHIIYDILGENLSTTETFEIEIKIDKTKS